MNMAVNIKIRYTTFRFIIYRLVKLWALYTSIQLIVSRIILPTLFKNKELVSKLRYLFLGNFTCSISDNLAGLFRHLIRGFSLDDKFFKTWFFTKTSYQPPILASSTSFVEIIVY